MKRQIKFRGWLPHDDINGKDHGRMFNVCNINFEHRDLLIDDEDTLFTINKIELMQYTGLTDKNGVEIYEGDIVFSGTGECKYNYIIDDLFCNFIINQYEDLDRMNYDNSLTEVIGNVYEHPHLLGH